MKSIKKILICFLAISGLSISPAVTTGFEKREPVQQPTQNQSDTTTVITLGISTIKKNRAAAKQNATNEALKDAIEHSLIRMMPDNDISSNLNLIYEAVNNHAENFIITYRIVGELAQKDKSIVAVESHINNKALIIFFNQKSVVNSDYKNSPDISENVTAKLVGKNNTDAAEKSSQIDKNSNLKTIKAKIEGSDYLSSFIMLRKTLNSMDGIKDVQTRDLSSEQASVTILFNGDGKHLAKELMLTSFDDFGLEISQITEDSLTIRFIPKADGLPVIEKKDMEGAYISE